MKAALLKRSHCVLWLAFISAVAAIVSFALLTNEAQVELPASTQSGDWAKLIMDSFLSGEIGEVYIT